MAEFRGLSPFQLPSAEIDRLLVRGERDELLRSYFGDEEYAELRDLARRASLRLRRGGPRVLILPGILGSTLGIRKARRDDLIWFDPLSIVGGAASKLALGTNGARVEPFDVIALLYTRLKWRLRWFGFEADYWPYDWRKGIDELGRELKKVCDKLGEVHLVAHSMGGLVARAAVAQGAASIQRVVMLGTPNAGSFVPVQVFRATSTSLRQVAALDLRHTSEQLVNSVFTTFPSLYQMLPFADHFQTLDLYSQSGWPKVPADLKPPRRALLERAVKVQRGLAEPDPSRFHLVAGYGQPTVVGMRRSEAPGDGEFLYEQSDRGDGTVPLDFAALPGMSVRYVEETHNGLPRNGRVAEAVSDLLRTGMTDGLSDSVPPLRRAVERVAESQLRAQPVFDGREGHAVTEREQRETVLALLSPVPLERAEVREGPAGEVAGRPGAAGLEAAPAAPRFDRIVVGRQRMHRLDLDLVNGSITDVDARAAVLGVFQNVKPSGPAEAFNERLGNVVDELVARRMFTAGLGEVFILPTGTHLVRPETVLFAGLGPFDAFTGEAQQVVAGNVLRTLVRAGVDEFVTVLFGGNSAEPPGVSLENLVRGFIEALLEADPQHRFRRIALCEKNAERYAAMKQRLYELAGTPLFEQVELTIDELPPPPPSAAPVPPRAAPRRWPEQDPVYLTVRWEALEDPAGEEVALRSSLLTAGNKATVISTLRQFSLAELKRLLARLPRLPSSKVAEFGQLLAERVLHPDMRDVLARDEFRERHLILAHDAESSRIPWEIVNFGDVREPRFPVVEAGVTRKYMADNMSIAKWLERRRTDATLEVLLIVNPTEDLAGAEEEGREIRKALRDLPTVRVTELSGPKADRRTLLRQFRSGRYDVVHYAGHAHFNSRSPELSGIRCAGGEVLSGADLRDIGNLPSLVFFNACESARIRAARAEGNEEEAERGEEREVDERARESAGFAEAFLRGGVANFIGTYWEVGDEAASTMATEFYRQVIDGQPMGQALLEARRAVQGGGRSKDWADYMVYGDPGFVLKIRSR